MCHTVVYSFVYSFMLWTGIAYVLLETAVVDARMHAISFT